MLFFKALISNEEDENIQYLCTYNPETKYSGFLTFCSDNENVFISQGKMDGSDDKVISYDSFIKDYDFFCPKEITYEKFDFNNINQVFKTFIDETILFDRSKDKMDFSKEEMYEWLDAEHLAYDIYYHNKNNLFKNDTIETLMNSDCFFINGNIKIPTLSKVKDILKRDYNIDLYSMPFKNSDLKNEIDIYESLNNKKDITYNKDI